MRKRQRDTCCGLPVSHWYCYDLNLIFSLPSFPGNGRRVESLNLRTRSPSITLCVLDNCSEIQNSTFMHKVHCGGS